MNIAIYTRPLRDDLTNYLHFLIDILEKANATVWIHKQTAASIEPSSKLKIFEKGTDLPRNTKCLITLGGDGTLLDSVAFTADKSIPVMGVNLGRLGFLASISAEMLEIALHRFMEKKMVTESRTLLQVSCEQPIFAEMPFGLNEFTLHRRDTSSMATIHAYLNGKYLNTYWADGLIVATSTGSTGYSLSCGGPIVSPQSANFVITPIAPHNLNVRPLVVPDNSILAFEIEDRLNNCLATLDSRVETVEKSVLVTVKKAAFDFKLLRFAESDFLETLRTKLYWGTDKRN